MACVSCADGTGAMPGGKKSSLSTRAPPQLLPVTCGPFGILINSCLPARTALARLADSVAIPHAPHISILTDLIDQETFASIHWNRSMYR